MIKTAYDKLLNKKQLILSKKNLLKNHVALSVATIASTMLVIFLMTGVLYFRNEVILTDGTKTYSTYTMFDEPDEILDELGIELSELDYYQFSGFDGSKATLDIMRAIEVKVIDGDISKTVQTKYLDDVATAIQRAGIKLGEFDTATPALTDKCSGKEEIKINRSVDVTVICDNKTLSLDSSSDTVGTLLSREGITLSDDDVVSPALDTKVFEGMKIVVQRVKYVSRVTVESIPYGTTEIESTLYPIGYSEVTSSGINGSMQITAIEKVVDGKVVSAEILEQEITNEPVDEIVAIGTAKATPYSKREFDEIILEDGIPVDYEFVVSGKSCAYTARAGSGTASGRKLEIGTVAVDPRVIPYGSLLYIVTQDGRSVYGAAVAADTGYLTDVVVDLYMGLTSEHYDTACDWGARYVDVYVINTGKY